MVIQPIEKLVSLSGWFDKTGIWDISTDRKEFTSNNDGKSKRAVVISNERVKSCDVSASITIESRGQDQESDISAGLIFLKQDENHYFLLGLASQRSKLVLAKVYLDEDTIWTKHIMSIGDSEDIIPNKQYSLRVRVENNGLVRVYINGGLALEKNLYLKLENDVLAKAVSQNYGKVGLFVGKNTKASFSNVSVNSLKWPPFVLIPSGRQDTSDHHFDILYESIINKACVEVGFGGAYREIDQHNSGSIIEDIINNIDQSEIVIIVLTDLNPNVCFELGYSFAMKKKIIVMAEKSLSQSLPFNFKDLRCLFYSADSSLKCNT